MNGLGDKKRNLGRGLEALLGAKEQSTDAPTSVQSAAVSQGAKKVAVFDLYPNKDQPRRHFDAEGLKELAISLNAHGMLQPILVRPHPEKQKAFEIVAGERRWRAAQQAKLHEVPVIIRELSDRDVAEIALVENLQRQDLNPMEEAQAYNRLIEDFGHTQEKLAAILGKSRPHLANMMRLLKLPAQVQEMVADGRLSAGHARAILANPNDPVSVANLIERMGLSVRQAEMLAKGELEEDVTAKKAKPPEKARKSADIVALEQEIAHVLGLSVKIDHQGKGGALAIHYKTLDDLDDILDRLTLGRYRNSR